MEKRPCRLVGDELGQMSPHCAKSGDAQASIAHAGQADRRIVQEVGG